MPLADVLTLSGSHRAEGWHLEPHDPLADRTGLEIVLTHCHDYGAWLSLGLEPEPDCVFVDLTGSARLHRSEWGLARRIQHELRTRHGWLVRIGIADTPTAAWAITRFEPHGSAASRAQRSVGTIQVVPPGGLDSILPRLPLAALRVSETVLKQCQELGVHTIGQLMGLSRASLPARFGSEPIRRLDELFGRWGEPWQLPPHVEPLIAEHTLEGPLTCPATLRHLLEHLTGQLVERIRRRNQGIVRLVARLRLERGSAREVEVALFRPTLSVRHLVDLVELDLERRDLGSPVVGLQIELVGLQRWQPQQVDLFNHRSHRAQKAWSQLVDRLARRLGLLNLQRAESVADAQPEHAYRAEPMVGANGKPVTLVARVWLTTARHRPLRLAPQPRRLILTTHHGPQPPEQFGCDGVHYRTMKWWGPERIETGWWRQQAARRDYFRVETQHASHVWIFRCLQEDRWYLHGWFD
jgi:protein ImuB